MTDQNTETGGQVPRSVPQGGFALRRPARTRARCPAYILWGYFRYFRYFRCFLIVQNGGLSRNPGYFVNVRAQRCWYLWCNLQ